MSHMTVIVFLSPPNGRPREGKTMNGLTTANLAALVALAGPGFDWPTLSGSAQRQSSPVNRSLVTYLARRQGHRCAWCGLITREEFIGGTDKRDGLRVEILHVVARGDKRGGFIPGNVFAGHTSCNDEMRTRGAIPDVSLYARPDVIATDWDGISQYHIHKSISGK